MKKIIFIFLSIILVYSYYSNRNTIQEIETINTKLASNDIRVNNNINMDNFKNIKIGDNKAYVISNIGKPSRIDYSEYNFKWYVYNEDLNKFAMVGIEEDNVVALYSNGIDSNEIDIRLSYFNINNDEVRSFDKTYNICELEQFVYSLVNKYLEIIVIKEEFNKIKNEKIK